MGLKGWIRKQADEAKDAAAERIQNRAQEVRNEIADRFPDSVRERIAGPNHQDARNIVEPPVFPREEDESAVGTITQRHWSDEPARQAVQIVWELGDRGSGVTPLAGRVVDPHTFERVHLLDPENVERFQGVAFRVAGTHVRRKELRRREFAVGQPVLLQPDPSNPYDENAIEVRDASGKYMVGFVPQDDEYDDVQRQALLHHWLQLGPVAALIISDRAWVEDGEPTERRGGLTVVAARSIQCVETPEKGDPGWERFRAAIEEARGARWPEERAQLRDAIDSADSVLDRHFAIQHMIEAAYRLRDVHPEALDDAIDACREQISLGPEAARAWRSEYPDDQESLPEHRGFKQLAIVLEKQSRYDEALEICREADQQGWNGDWSKRIERIEIKKAST